MRQTSLLCFISSPFAQDAIEAPTSWAKKCMSSEKDNPIESQICMNGWGCRFCSLAHAAWRDGQEATNLYILGSNVVTLLTCSTIMGGAHLLLYQLLYEHNTFTLPSNCGWVWNGRLQAAFFADVDLCLCGHACKLQNG